jgi:Mn2+/Fe2+ NRAMP family transporter
VSRLLSVLLWSVISAAFIGPGTVTSAASAGAGYGYALLWALVFSTLACLVLQEASARLTVASGKNLGEALRQRAQRGWRRTVTLLLILGAIVLGCAAYEAGNILGGVAGASLALPLSPQALTVATVAAAGLLLWLSSPRRVALLLSVLVGVMGVTFLWTAFRLGPSLGALLEGGLRPSLPAGSSLLAVALVGTTVVPYNLFLGSSLAAGQKLSEIRFGLAVAVLLGGLISMGVLVVGAATEPPLEFQNLSAVLAERLGDWARILFAVGLFSAGLSSAVTAPLAAALTARSVLAAEGGEDRWGDRSWRFRSVWMGVLAVGLLFGLSDLPRVPVIVLAQALNGILLPVVAVFLFVSVNDREVMGGEVNRTLSNAVMVAVTLVAFLLGATNVVRALARLLGG